MKYLLRVSLLAVAVALLAPASQAQEGFFTFLTGPNENPSNASPGTGVASVVIDDVAHTMFVHVTFSGLIGNTTASHIHAAAIPPANAGVATTTPSFPGFPTGVTSGSYTRLFDMTLASSYNPAFVTNNGGTTALAETALFNAIRNGQAYWNIHTSSFPGGEIRGFLAAAPEPASAGLMAFGLGLGALVVRRRKK